MTARHWLDQELCRPPTLAADDWFWAVLASLSETQKDNLLIWLGTDHPEDVERGLRYLAANGVR